MTSCLFLKWAFILLILRHPRRPWARDSCSDDTLYDQAVAIVAKDRKCFTSHIQRVLGIGYNKVACLLGQMETDGAVTPANHVRKQEILAPAD